MAGADYFLCCNCSSKAVYDPGIDLDVSTLGQIEALCSKCVQSGVKLLVSGPDTTAMAAFLKEQAQRRYVHNPASTTMITWPQFNELLRTTIDLCNAVNPEQEGPHA